MRVFMLHVGDPLAEDASSTQTDVLRLPCLKDGQIRSFRRKDLVNAMAQMEAIVEEGVDIDFQVLTDRKSLVQLLRAGWQLRRLVGARPVDVVHVMWGTTTALMAVAFAPAPVIVSFCGSDLYGTLDVAGRPTLAGRLSRSLSRLSARFAHGIIVKSVAMLPLLNQDARTKARVIPNGVDLSRFEPIERTAARAILGWEQSQPVIMFFPGSGLVKDQPLADRVVDIVRGRYPTLRVVMPRDVIHETLRHYYSAADVMLLTSRHEGSNNSLKEAMACNLPVVSVRCGDAEERLTGVVNCHVVGTRSAHDLAERVMSVLASGERSNGREHIRALTTESVAAAVHGAYREVVREVTTRKGEKRTAPRGEWADD